MATNVIDHLKHESHEKRIEFEPVLLSRNSTSTQVER